MSRIEISSIKEALADGSSERACRLIVDSLDPEADFAFHHKLVRLFRKIPDGAIALKPLRLAVLATSTVDQLCDVLRLYLAREGYALELFTGEYDTMIQTVLDPASDLYQFKPDVVWLFTNHRDINVDASGDKAPDAIGASVEGAVDQLISLVDVIRKNCVAQVILNSADRPLERLFGNFDGRVPFTRTSIIRHFNLALAQNIPSGAHIFDLEYIANSVGLNAWHDESYWLHSKHAFSPNVTAQVAHAAARMITGIKGGAHKCLVLDLDNTLWGGIIGDDGIGGIALGQGDAAGEAFLAFQKYLKSLSERGVILTVCSKNEADIAAEAVRKHPEMVLRMEDFAVFTCNWSNKADNIRAIAETLEIGVESLVFVDDNPVERQQVRGELPMIAVPEMPEDPALYVRALDRQMYFETASFTSEDQKRGSMYRNNAKRKVLKQQFSDIDFFLKDLKMEASVGAFDSQNLPRISQLINKSNQFHLTTTRYSESQIESMLESGKYEGFWVKLQDRFGDNGLISAIILEHGDDGVSKVDTWVMSCRVLARGVEDFIHNEMVAAATRRGSERLQGRYIPTKKNKLVADVYSRLGWEAITEADGEWWEIQLLEPSFRPNHIKKVSP